ncbi:hypothetical protein ASPZODRAFT_23008 [Penicilliopsis zonata CBS 506.65]|uniref:Prolyl 4-hydroxylase alpha subunit domain-containing protein n=1 Tax=Penicilliopsis zonata CBS 506.65 TaxID=1073090 RepID=A0A1L9ST24_9EURO|nr:hypothetical protein ASPZODRAFT_23008 [Penicilliopsis zonata CBS 506.65]OJJ50355.1 hypothetical protein ASPZODRAFT_23008 [Penicilliopsis zonata CBS 506.65]
MASLRNFLLQPARNATLRRIDFTQTTPPIPAFKDHFAVVIDDFMTEAECKELLRLATTTGPWERAMINVGNGKQTMSVETRDCGRIIWDNPEIAQRIFDRLVPFFRECGLEEIRNQPLVTGLGSARRGEVFHLSQLNERLRFLRYEGGEYFRPHWDGCYLTPDGSERSLYTIHLYLDGSGEQDIQELEKAIKKLSKHPQQPRREEDEGRTDRAETETLLGGATSFTDSWTTEDAVRVFPRAGSVLIFQQRNLLHGGDDVFRGVKHTMRTDLMYRVVE